MGLLWTGCAPACVLCSPLVQIRTCLCAALWAGDVEVLCICDFELLFPPRRVLHQQGATLQVLLWCPPCSCRRAVSEEGVPRSPPCALLTCDSPWSCGGQGTVGLPALLSIAQASCAQSAEADAKKWFHPPPSSSPPSPPPALPPLLLFPATLAQHGGSALHKEDFCVFASPPALVCEDISEPQTPADPLVLDSQHIR